MDIPMDVVGVSSVASYTPLIIRHPVSTLRVPHDVFRGALLLPLPSPSTTLAALGEVRAETTLRDLSCQRGELSTAQWLILAERVGDSCLYHAKARTGGIAMR